MPTAWICVEEAVASFVREEHVTRLKKAIQANREATLEMLHKRTAFFFTCEVTKTKVKWRQGIFTPVIGPHYCIFDAATLIEECYSKWRAHVSDGAQWLSSKSLMSSPLSRRVGDTSSFDQHIGNVANAVIRCPRATSFKRSEVHFLALTLEAVPVRLMSAKNLHTSKGLKRGRRLHHCTGCSNRGKTKKKKHAIDERARREL